MIKKNFLKTKCKVEFALPTQDGVTEVALVGSFNNWDIHQTLLEKNNGKFKTTLDLPLEQDFEFRYLVNGQEWQNDSQADYRVANPFGEENSVISTYHPK